jgi:UDP-N-acetylmuramyl pentapeptide phosphotransferase/UDP-N-acetylglucosamine-1-phosphate transferase
MLVASSLILMSFALTWSIMRYSLTRNILDIPNERSSHTHPTPRGGGLAIVISGSLDRNLYFALLCGVLLAVISLIDDLFDIKPLVRLIAHTTTALASLIFLDGIHQVLFFGKEIFPNIVLYVITIVGMVWFINLYNFLDGIDGYASVEAIMMSLALFLFSGNSITLILIASVSGFLIWNWPKARIFMGDVGSTQLGFILVVLGIYLHNERNFSIIYWLILAAPFWFDATLTLYRRWRRKEKLSQAHRKHIYQRLVQSGFSHLQVDIFLSLLNVILIVAVYFCIKHNSLQIPLLILIIASLYIVSIYADNRKPF